MNDVGITWLPPIRLTDASNPRVELLITAPGSRQDAAKGASNAE